MSWPTIFSGTIPFWVGESFYFSLLSELDHMLSVKNNFLINLLFFRNATLQQISKKVPRTKEELLEINGIGK